MDDAQQEVIAFLRNPSSYPPATGPVEVIETHASLVFLAGRRAYKLKRAVKYPYLDFSTLARRRAACTAELRLNRRTAPSLYLEVRAISRAADGAIVWGRPPGAGEPLDFVVVMRRFEQGDLLDNVARAGRLSEPVLYALAAHVAAFHAKAQARPEHGGAAAMRAVAEENFAVLRASRAAGFAEGQVERLAAAVADELSRHAALLDRRRAAGRVRRVHGDLHLRNVCLVDGKPLLFDCIEFSEDIATVDTLYDLAFLLMDLDHSGHPAFANLVLNRYLDLSEEDDGLALLPLFLSLRAAIRAHVTATMAEHGWGGGDPSAARAEARRYLAEAEAVLAPQPARLVAIGGLSGSGKSTVAAALAAALGRRPGARVLRSDVLRKLRLGEDPESPLPPAAYTPEVTARVYRDLCERAAAALDAGWPAVIDAVALREEERQAFAAVAAAAGVPFTGLWLEAPRATLRARLVARRGDASDASPEVLAEQLGRDPGPLQWLRLDANGDPAATLAAARRALLH
ncbi:MAG TPA: AAA family ATPase [Stellaceae bacterium]|nr:AAA family ATPase [Stellaceae bacterium]